MWKFSHTVSVAAPREVIWDLWTNVEKWPDWDPQLEEACLDGDVFETNATGKMKAVGQAPISFTLTDVVIRERYTVKSGLFGAQLQFVHELVEKDGATEVTLRAELSGWLSWLWSWFMVRGIRRSIPESLQNLAHVVQERVAQKSAGLPTSTNPTTTEKTQPAPQQESTSQVSAAQPEQKNEALVSETAVDAPAQDEQKVEAGQEVPAAQADIREQVTHELALVDQPKVAAKEKTTSEAGQVAAEALPVASHQPEKQDAVSTVSQSETEKAAAQPEQNVTSTEEKKE